MMMEKWIIKRIYLVNKHILLDQDNYMVKCHSGQGISLKCELPAGASATASNRRKICTDVPAEVSFRMFVRGGADPRKYLQVFFGKTQLEAVLLPSEAEDGTGWHELRFRPVRVPAGEYELRIELKNPDPEKAVVYLDDLILQMKQVQK